MRDWVVTARCLHTLGLPATLLNFKGFLPCFLSLQFRKEILSVQFRGIQPNSFWSEIKADAHRLSEKRKGKQNAKCEWFRSLLLNVYHVWAGLFSWDKWTKMQLKLQTEKRLQNGGETQFSNGSISVPLCHVVLFNIVRQTFPQHLIVLKVGIILVEITTRKSRVWATDYIELKLRLFLDSDLTSCVYRDRQ